MHPTCILARWASLLLSAFGERGECTLHCCECFPFAHPGWGQPPENEGRWSREMKSSQKNTAFPKSHCLSHTPLISAHGSLVLKNFRPAWWFPCPTNTRCSYSLWSPVGFQQRPQGKRMAAAEADCAPLSAYTLQLLPSYLGFAFTQACRASLCKHEPKPKSSFV